MKPPRAGWRVNEVKQLPTAITSYLAEKDDTDNYVDGGILKDCKIAWLSNGSRFTVVNLSTRQKIASWTFGAVLRDLKAHITCVCEIPPLIDNTIQILVGLECELVGGMVCLLHCNGSFVVRAIQVDCRITSLHYVDKLRGPLQCFDGAVIIGTHGGATLIFDLDREACQNGIEQASRGNSHLLKNELNLANLVVLSLDNIELIEEQRVIACEKEEHIAIHINEGCIHHLQFLLRHPDRSIQLETNRENVLVTSILYVEQLSSIVIGFNIGAFQLWNVKNLNLEYTSHIYHENLAITHLGFMEPCDDPRAFCYLWVLYSSMERHSEGFPLAIMYSLTYRGKKTLDSSFSLYEDFLICNLRFNIELGVIDNHNNAAKQIVGGRSIACYAISQNIQDNDDDDRTLNICQIVWECWSVSVITPIYSAMLIFDIDQWYKEQMPDCSILETNRYMSIVNITEGSSKSILKNICDIRINPSTLSPYMPVQRLEEHFYPNSLNFECLCLSDCDVIRFSATGIQNELLQTINKSGPSILLNPSKIFHQCISSGLIPLYSEVNSTSEMTTIQYRQLILSVALEASMVRFLLKCATEWANDSFASSDCSLHFLIEWCWSRSLILKMNGDQLSVPLFDHSGDTLDSNTSRCFNSCTTQLSDISKILSLLLEKCSIHVLPNLIYEIKQRQKAIQMVGLYFQVIQWFLDVGLLPEFHSDREILDKYNRLPYPLESLINFYQNRRLKLHRMNGVTNTDADIQNRHCDFLYIDQFIKKECGNDSLARLWNEESSSTNGLYPPPSLHALLKIYLIPNISDEHKHSLILYALIDYAMMYNDVWYAMIIRRLMQFPTVFGLKNSTIKVTQAFWHLDHKDFDYASTQLHHVLANGCLVQWQHEVALSAFSIQKKSQLALQYLQVRKACTVESSDPWDDWEVSCNLYLSRDLIVQAFELVKSTFSNSSSEEVKKKRLLTFFEACRKHGTLSKVSSLPFSNDEENVFVKYLLGIGDIDSCNLLIAYYLERSRYIEAKQVNEDMKINKAQLPYDLTNDFSMTKQHTHKTKTRDQLVDMYCKTLPKITRHLSQFATGRNESRKTTMPTPLTVNVQEAATKVVSYKSSVIQNTIDKVNETWLERPSIVRGIKRALQVEDTPFICTPKLRKLMSRCDDYEMVPIYQNQSVELSESIVQITPTKDKLSPKLQKEMELLLHTPIIEKRTHWPSDTSVGQSSDAFSIRTATPQSILKVKKLLHSIEEHHLAETDDELDNMSQHTQSDLSRSIRFNIPSASNTPSPASSTCGNQESFDEMFDYGEKKTKMAISPRKSIHEVCDSQMHKSPISSPTKKLKTSDPSVKEYKPKPIEVEDDDLGVKPLDTEVVEEKVVTPKTPFSPKGRKSYRKDVELYTSTPSKKSEPSSTQSSKVLTPIKQKSSLSRKVLEASLLAKITESELDIPESPTKEYLTRSKTRSLLQSFTSESILMTDTSDDAISTITDKADQTEEIVEEEVEKPSFAIAVQEIDKDDEKTNQSEASLASTPSLTIDEKDDLEDEEKVDNEPSEPLKPEEILSITKSEDVEDRVMLEPEIEIVKEDKNIYDAALFTSESECSSFVKSTLNIVTENMTYNSSLMTEDESILEDTSPIEISEMVEDEVNMPLPSESVNPDDNIVLHFDDDTQNSDEIKKETEKISSGNEKASKLYAAFVEEAMEDEEEEAEPDNFFNDRERPQYVHISDNDEEDIVEIESPLAIVHEPKVESESSSYEEEQIVEFYNPPTDRQEIELIQKTLAESKKSQHHEDIQSESEDQECSEEEIDNNDVFRDDDVVEEYTDSDVIVEELSDDIGEQNHSDEEIYPNMVVEDLSDNSEEFEEEIYPDIVEDISDNIEEEHSEEEIHPVVDVEEISDNSDEDNLEIVTDKDEDSQEHESEEIVSEEPVENPETDVNEETISEIAFDKQEKQFDEKINYEVSSQKRDEYVDVKLIPVVTSIDQEENNVETVSEIPLHVQEVPMIVNTDCGVKQEEHSDVGINPEVVSDNLDNETNYEKIEERDNIEVINEVASDKQERQVYAEILPQVNLSAKTNIVIEHTALSDKQGEQTNIETISEENEVISVETNPEVTSEEQPINVEITPEIETEKQELPLDVVTTLGMESGKQEKCIDVKTTSEVELETQDQPMEEETAPEVTNKQEEQIHKESIPTVIRDKQLEHSIVETNSEVVSEKQEIQVSVELISPDSNVVSIEQKEPVNVETIPVSTKAISEKQEEEESSVETILKVSAKKRTKKDTSERSPSIASEQDLSDTESLASASSKSSRPSTPKRIPRTPTRATRSSAKKLNVIQEESQSSDDFTEEPKPAVTKIRATRISTKPNLSVISEKSHIEDPETPKAEDVATTLEKYALQRRLTRHQKSILEKSMELMSPKPSSSVIQTPEQETGRRGSLKKTQSEPSRSPSRRISMDIDPFVLKPSDTPTKGLASVKLADESVMYSPSGRPRRQSFNKAVEALHTPRKRRRSSTDSKTEDDNLSVSSSIEDKSILGKPDARFTSSKLLPIDENEQENDEGSTTVIKAKTKPQRRKKAASVHGDIVSQSEFSSPAPSRSRMSQIVTPLSKEERLALEEDSKGSYRRSKRASKISQPIKFVVKKD